MSNYGQLSTIQGVLITIAGIILFYLFNNDLFRVFAIIGIICVIVGIIQIGKGVSYQPQYVSSYSLPRHQYSTNYTSSPTLTTTRSEVINCQECGTQNQTVNKYCINCSKPLFPRKQPGKQTYANSEEDI